MEAVIDYEFLKGSQDEIIKELSLALDNVITFSESVRHETSRIRRKRTQLA